MVQVGPMSDIETLGHGLLRKERPGGKLAGFHLHREVEDRMYLPSRSLDGRESRWRPGIGYLHPVADFIELGKQRGFFKDGRHRRFAGVEFVAGVKGTRGPATWNRGVTYHDL